jgi:hypothetical protein
MRILGFGPAAAATKLSQRNRRHRAPAGRMGWHPRMSSRLGLYRLVQMPGSHELIFTNPNLLTDKIIEAGRD